MFGRAGRKKGKKEKRKRKKGEECAFGERRRGSGAGGRGEGRIEESREEQGSTELTFDTQEVHDAAWISFVSL